MPADTVLGEDDGLAPSGPSSHYVVVSDQCREYVLKSTYRWCSPKLWPSGAGYLFVVRTLNLDFRALVTAASVRGNGIGFGPVAGRLRCLHLHLHSLLHMHMFEPPCGLDKACRATPPMESYLVILCMGSLIHFECDAVPSCQGCLNKFLRVGITPVAWTVRRRVSRMSQ